MREALPFHDAAVEWDVTTSPLAQHRPFDLYSPERDGPIRVVRILEARKYSEQQPGTVSYVYETAAGRVTVNSFDELMEQLQVKKRN